ncbi:MAG: sulfotransferase family protein [Marinoscillum sp.]|uniref:sulfotransferase-like domain-containing protein n=1 Tax=Marinoscillum sp. TaxID=2024838 RepID=UPI0032F3C441
MIINLISSPRNISTALMYSFAHRPYTKVMDEPFYGYYLNLTEADHPGKEAIIASQPKTVSEVRNWIQHTASQHEVVFVKNMAHHLINMNIDFLEDYRNVFLIRDPQQLITSFAKVIPNPQMTDIGVARQYELYEKLLETQSCPVIDSNEVLKNPEKVLRQLCQALGLTFEPSMLQWPAGALAEDGVWAEYWYKNVHASTGFEKKVTAAVALPPECEALYTEALPLYEKMVHSAIKA